MPLPLHYWVALAGDEEAHGRADGGAPLHGGGRRPPGRQVRTAMTLPVPAQPISAAVSGRCAAAAAAAAGARMPAHRDDLASSQQIEAGSSVR